MSKEIERRLVEAADLVDERELAWKSIVEEEKKLQVRKAAAYDELNQAREVQKAAVADAVGANMPRGRIALVGRLSRVTVNKYADEKGETS